MNALRRKTLREEDFVEDEQRNRDPFRSYLSLFIEKTPVQTYKVPAIFEKYALEELRLIAVVTGGARPLAMFKDPGGLGRTVRRGDFVSKLGARVKNILSDRVVLEIREVDGGGVPTVIQKAVLVNPEGARGS